MGTRVGYMMNYFLTYDSATLPVATGITLTAATATGMQDEVVTADGGRNRHQPLLPRLYAGRDRQRKHGGDQQRQPAHLKHRNRRRGDPGHGDQRE